MMYHWKVSQRMTKPKYNYWRTYELQESIQQKDDFWNQNCNKCVAIEIYLQPVTIRNIRPGCCNKPKGMLQILYERGFIDVTLVRTPRSMRYSKDGKKEEMDAETGEVKDECKCFSLTHLLSQCTDFINQKLIWNSCVRKFLLISHNNASWLPSGPQIIGSKTAN